MEFERLTESTLFLGSPGDLDGLRSSIVTMFRKMRREVADPHGVECYSWGFEKSKTDTGIVYRGVGLRSEHQ